MKTIMAEKREEEEQKKKEMEQDPFYVLTKEVFELIFAKLANPSTTKSSWLHCLSHCSLVSKRFASLLFQTTIDTVTFSWPVDPTTTTTPPPPSSQSPQNPNNNNDNNSNNNNTTTNNKNESSVYNFISKFASIRTLHFELSYPNDIIGYGFPFASPTVKWKANFRFNKCCVIFLFAKGGSGAGFWPVQLAIKWCLQLSWKKFNALARGYFSLLSLFEIYNGIMACRAVITDPQTPGGAIVLDQQYIEEVKKNVRSRDGNGMLEMSCKCWITMSRDGLDMRNGNKLVIVRNVDSTEDPEDLESIVRTGFEGEKDEDLVEELVAMVKLKPTYGI